MDTTPGGVQCTVEGVGLSVGGSVRHQAHLSTGGLYLPIPGPHGNSDRCLFLQLGPSGTVCLFSFPSSEEGPQQAPGLSGNYTHPDSPILAPKGMVPRPNTSNNGHSSMPSSSIRPPVPITCPSFPSHSPYTTASRMETVKQLLRHWVYSGRAVHFLLPVKCHSTTMNYQYKWNQYCWWCREHGHTVSSPSNHKFADFLLYF